MNRMITLANLDKFIDRYNKYIKNQLYLRFWARSAQYPNKATKKTIVGKNTKRKASEVS